jgi:type IV pilus assembly protein PilQ
MGTSTRVIADRPPSPAPHHGRKIDLDVKGADIHDVLRLLADVGRVNIVVGDDVQGSVTLRMRQVPWDQALDVIVSVRGLFAERDGNVIIVSAKLR